MLLIETKFAHTRRCFEQWYEWNTALNVLFSISMCIFQGSVIDYDLNIAYVRNMQLDYIAVQGTS